ncbi:polysaccharide pyruvyl transferase family protein [Pontibacter virosus]|uniref:Polysaccharide pyruvyl transferase n=1 Tax=Pontibacter virosus TaxID=1765052 RepID=A0A2U1B2Y2_9BACT|nr:polysaccharide pyruvyl transferase family protein [Pontibacter virosus]PVY43030.1 polysaccharide pyruvyl transferase [Pontibacter virosus]
MIGNKVKLWWCREFDNGIENFGDGLSPYIVAKVSGKKVIRASLKSKSFLGFNKINFAIGSILKKATPNSNVWGSGIISQKDTIQKANFYAVRGPRSRKRLLELGYTVPEVYGDPGLLISKYFMPSVSKQYRYGIIPHHVDYELVKSKIQTNEILVINLLDPIEKVVQDILMCDKTISSSLHGIIVSHSYGIPSLIGRFSNKLSGDGIKFIDYCESVGIKESSNLWIGSSDLLKLTDSNLNKMFSDKAKEILPQNDLSLMMDKLIASNPY